LTLYYTDIMRILYIFKTIAAWGGIERVIVSKMNYLADHYDDEVVLFTTDQGEHRIPFRLSTKVVHKDLNIRFTDQYKYHGMRRLIDSYQRHRRFNRDLKAAIRDINPDIIVGTADMYAYTIMKYSGDIPFIVESHTSYKYTRWVPDMSLRQKVLRYFYMRNLRKAATLVTLTNADAEDWKRWNSNVVVIPNMVDLNTSGEYSDCSNHSAIFVGRLAYQKGWRYLLEIWHKVHERYPDWTLNVFGDGEDKDAFISQLNKYDDKLGIVLHSPTEKIFEEYKKNSLLMLTSVFEPFGLVIPEAQSCGLPVVSFEGYGPNDIITDGKDGYVIPQFDTDKYADRICSLLADGELRRNMGREGIASSRRYAAERIMPEWRNLFECLTAKSR